MEAIFFCKECERSEGTNSGNVLCNLLLLTHLGLNPLPEVREVNLAGSEDKKV